MHLTCCLVGEKAQGKGGGVLDRPLMRLHKRHACILRIHSFQHTLRCTLPGVHVVDDPLAELAEVQEVLDQRTGLGLEVSIEKAVEKGKGTVVSLRLCKQVVQGRAWGQARFGGEGGTDGDKEGGRGGQGGRSSRCAQHISWVRGPGARKGVQGQQTGAAMPAKGQPAGVQAC
eukprot:1160745-Pelagomonas_calceolata.AAC.22